MAVSFINNASIAAGAGISTTKLGAGAVLQVVNSQTNGGTFSTTSTSFVDTGYSLSITPTASSSKILIIVTASITTTSTSQQVGATLYRGATSLNTAGLTNYENSSGSGYQWVPSTMMYLDSPSTTSSTSYKVFFKTTGGTGYYGAGNAGVSFTLMEIAA